jgi:large subunit ribosomal protein L13
MKTFSAKSDEVSRSWHLVDAKDQVLGRLACRVAAILRGKHKPIYTPHVDTGDYVVIINAEQVRVTGRKPGNKMYHRHTGYPGGIKAMSFNELQEKHPERVLELAIKGMLPKGPLGRQMYRKLKVYAGSEHPHTGQQPEPINLEEQR